MALRLSALRIPPVAGHRDHLCPFALQPAFPASLAGRYSCDYYGHSVAIGLAPRRRSRGTSSLYVRARRRPPTHLLDRPRWAVPRTPKGARPHGSCRAGSGIGHKRHSDGCSLSPLEIGLQAIKPWPYRAGLAAPRPGRLQTATASLACSCPLALSRPGKPGDPETSLRVPPGCAGDTTTRLTAHTVRDSLPSHGSSYLVTR